MRGVFEEAGMEDEAVKGLNREKKTRKFTSRMKERILPSGES